MTDDTTALRPLLEKSPDADFLRDMIGFAAERLQNIELRCARELKAMPEIAPHFVSDSSAPLAD